MKKFRNVAAKAKSTAAKAATVATAALATAPAFAGELATAATSAMDPAELTLIGVGVMALVGVVVLIRKGSRAAGG